MLACTSRMLLLPLVVLVGFGSAGLVQGQRDAARRQRARPFLMPKVEAPLAPVRTMKFVQDPDGKMWLYSAGEDKVVRQWSLVEKGGRLIAKQNRLLMWPVFESRGSIFAMDIENDGTRGHRLVLGGYGVESSLVVAMHVDAPEQARVVYSKKLGGGEVVQGLDLVRTSTGAFTLLAAHDNIGVGEGKEGHIPYWHWADGNRAQPKRYVFSAQDHFDHVRSVFFSPDRKRFAATGIRKDGQTVVVVWKREADNWREEGPFAFGQSPPTGLAWRDNDTWVLGTDDGVYVGDEKVFDGAGKIIVKQVASAPAKKLVAYAVVDANTLKCAIHLRQSGRPVNPPLATPFSGDLTALAISPDGRWIAASGLGPIGPKGQFGQAIYIWDSNSKEELAAIPDSKNAGAVGGPIANLAVLPGLVKKDIVFADQVAFSWGPWVRQDNREKVAPLKRVFNPEGGKLAPFNGEQEFPSNIYQFLDAPNIQRKYIAASPLTKGAKGEDVFGPVSPTPGIQTDAKMYAFVRFTHRKSGRELLAIGQTSGIIVWDAKELFSGLGAKKMRDEGLVGNNAQSPLLEDFFKKAILRRFWGHVGATTILAASPNGDYLVSGGRDGTIRGWSLEGIGAKGMASNRFGLKNEFGLRIDQTQRVLADPPLSSPAAEAGFKQGDKIIHFLFNGRKLKTAGLTDWDNFTQRTLFFNPIPGGDAYFTVSDANGVKNLQSRNTRDPLWVLYPQFDGNWSLTTPQGYYHTSTATFGRYQWLVNLNAGESIEEANFQPQVKVYPEHLFSDLYHQEEKVADAVMNQTVLAPLLNAIPPTFQFGALAIPKNGPINVRVVVTPNDVAKVKRVELYLNGFRLSQRDGRAVVSREDLRDGENRIVATAVMAEGKRFSDVKILGRFTPTQRGERKIHFLGIGVEKIKKHPEMKLSASANDVQAMAEVLKKVCPNMGNVVVLTDEQAPTKKNPSPTQENILEKLDAFTRGCGPDDLAIIMFSGHGLVDKKTSQYVYMCADAEKGGKLTSTGVTAQMLQDKFSQLNCRSVVLLDTCRSRAADAASQTDSFPGRSFGPILLSACRGKEEATEGQGHGAFTLAILEALDGKRRFKGGNLEKAQRAAIGNGPVTLAELIEYVIRVTPNIKNVLKEDGSEQNPNLLPSVTFGDAGEIVLAP